MTNKILMVGDVHAVPNELADCARLIQYVIDIANKTGTADVLFLGDLFNTHELVRLEVLDFWQRSFDLMTENNINPVCLVGNHDRAGAGRKENALSVFEDSGVLVISDPIAVHGILHIPYMDDPKEFVELCKANDKYSTVICHQTFNGAKYENGFYAPDGVDQNDIPQQTVISGHIHTPQTFGKVRYIGAPRWRSAADMSVEERYLSLATFENGVLVGTAAYPLSGTTRKLVKLIDTAETPVDLSVLNDFDSYTVEIRGTKEHFLKRRAELSRANVKTKFFRIENKTIPKGIRESDGIAVALMKYVGQCKTKYGTSNEVLRNVCQERLKCLAIGPSSNP